MSASINHPSSAALQSASVTQLRGIGPTTATRLAKLGVASIFDILLHLPFRYEDRTVLTPLAEISDGQSALMVGRIEKCTLQFGRRPTLLVQIADGDHQLCLRFFQFNAKQKELLQAHIGQSIRCYGLVRKIGRRLELIHPEYWLLKEGSDEGINQTLTPIYPSTEGISQRLWQRLIAAALQWLDHYDAEINAINLLWQNLSNLAPASWSFQHALHLVHQPPKDVDVAQLLMGTHPAQQRLAFEELLAHHLSLRRLKQQLEQRIAPQCHVTDAEYEKFIKQLPFQLTHAQQRVGADIRMDMQQQHPMLRLVQGDVGCGKTVVAALAAFFALARGWQVAMMAPTELLAHQLTQTMARFFAQPILVQGKLQSIIVAELTGRLPSKESKVLREQLRTQQVHLIVGTHALFQKEVVFSNLGLVMIDEQHRFGVAQRMALWQKGDTDKTIPHQLMLTATPIPRTLAMTLYADIAYSVIDELPPQRKPITTVVVNNQRRPEVIERIRHAVANKKQVYWVCTQIVDSEAMNCQAAENALAELQAALLHVRCAMVHGKMKNDIKHEVMHAFKEGHTQVLVATTVIEVGVDVPNATLMIIENAERLGLAQLHQLRGRVGRGEQESFCVLLYAAPLSDMAQARLAALRASQDGFELAQKDLTLRGPGELLGKKQTGALQFKIANILRDQHLLTHIAKSADWLFSHEPEAISALIARWVGDEIVNLT